MMGSYLTESLKENYFPVGFAFNEGSFQAMGRSAGGGPTDLRKWDVAPAKSGSLEADLDTLAKPLFFLNIESMSTEGRKWIDVARQTRNIGAVYDEAMAEQFYAPQSVGQIYRGLIFIKKTTRSRPL
jgi:erythromycin esterase